MKKLMTILVVFAMCGTALAAKPGSSSSSNKRYDLSMDTETRVVGTETVKEWQWKNGHRTLVDVQKDITETVKVATTHDYTNATGTTGLKYTVTSNNGSVFGQNADSRYIGQLYFTTKDVQLQNGEVLAVQFMGTDDSDHGATLAQRANYEIKDYGIYLYDPETGNHLSDYMSMGFQEGGYKNYFEIGPDQNFGIYYINKQGEYITSTENYVANYDGDDHEITIYSETVNGVTIEYPEGKKVTTSKRYMCMFEENKMVWPHWEFMLQTTIDNPYYDVNPEDFGGNGSTDVSGNTTSGQPLPGTLATLLIGGLCAGSLRKRNKK